MNASQVTQAHKANSVWVVLSAHAKTVACSTAPGNTLLASCFSLPEATHHHALSMALATLKGNQNDKILAQSACEAVTPFSKSMCSDRAYQGQQ